MNYLEEEFFRLIQEDQEITKFLLEGSLDGVWYWDLENPEQEWMSPSFWKTLGIDPQTKKHLSDEWQDLIFPEDLEKALDNFNRHCADPNCPYDQLVRYKHENGSTVWVRCRGIVIRDDQGVPKRMLGAHNEVTELVEGSLKIESLNKSLNQSVAELEEFFYAVTHDLQSPIRGIVGFSEYLLESDLDSESKAMLEQIHRSGIKLQSLLVDIKQLSLVGKTKNQELFNVNKVLDQVRFNVESNFPDKKITWKIDNMPPLLGNSNDYYRMFYNLSSNGVKYNSEEPEIQIRWDHTENSNVFRVIDDGIGIDPKYHEQIFKLFNRLHSDNEYPGTGAGLSLVQKIVTSYEGEIRITSEEGSGSTFEIEIWK